MVAKLNPEQLALKSAADAAEKLMPAAIVRRNQLSKELSSANTVIGSLHAVISAWKAQVAEPAPNPEPGTLFPTAGSPTQNAGPEEQSGVRAPRGMVYEHVRQVLSDGGLWTEPKLQAEMKARFKVNHSHSSVYRALNAGLKAGTYVNDDGKWQAKVFS